MEIKFKNVIFKNCDVTFDFNIKSDKVFSIIPNNLDIIKLFDSVIVDGEIQIDKVKINNKVSIKKMSNIKEKIYLCDSFENLFNVTVLQDFKTRIFGFDDSVLEKYLTMFNLDKKILSMNYMQLSSSEKVKVLLICGLMTDKNIIVFNFPELYLDDRSKLILVKELKKLKRRKSVILISNDLEFLLMVSDDVVMFNENNKAIYGNKYEVLGNKIILKNVGMNAPKILEFRNVAFDLKKAKLLYRDNINDIIKDIYRNAR